MSTIGSIGALDSRASFAWRGMRSIDYDCTSSLHRTIPTANETQLRQREKEVLDEARNWGLGYGPGGWISDLQLLADLQHYGTSTRLIDVTSDPMTALWFACQEVTEGDVSRSGVLLAMDTSSWRRFGRTPPDAAPINDLAWELSTALGSNEPFVVEALQPNDRLRAQNGYFIASRVPARPDNESPFPSLGIDYEIVARSATDQMLRYARSTTSTAVHRIPFLAIRVKAEWKPRLLRMLENTYNRRASVLFPDWTGFRDFSMSAVPRLSNEEVDARKKR